MGATNNSKNDSIPSPDSVTGSQHEQNPETEAAKWNSAVIKPIIYTCAFPIVTRQNEICRYELLIRLLQ